MGLRLSVYELRARERGLNVIGDGHLARLLQRGKGFNQELGNLNPLRVVGTTAEGIQDQAKLLAIPQLSLQRGQTVHGCGEAKLLLHQDAKALASEGVGEEMAGEHALHV